ncbi:MAG: ParB/Srx family N-terminal domain-containing protein [Clostridium sp.]|nr:ParB/Srx family N-terminal domain-containing protein [Clostridium sp.]
MSKVFDLEIGSSVLIYGAGELGQSIYNRIKHIYSIKCFIDRTISALRDNSIEIRNLDNISEYTNSVVLICVHNANWHNEIAEQLYKLGFNKILFLAFSNTYQKEASYTMNRLYNLFMEEEYNLLTDIPTYSTVIQKTSKEKILRETSSYIVVYCAKELIYSSLPDNKIYSENLDFDDIPMIANKLYINLFRFFMYGQGDADLYVKTMKNINNSFDMSDKDFSQSQYSIYQLLENEYAKGIDFINLMPVDVKWNPKGYFNILDGHHRCAFYILKGMQTIPVRMTKKDYNLWMNNACIKQIQTILTHHQLRPAMYINHPILSEYQCKYIEYETTLLDIFQQWLYSLKKNFTSALEISPYQAYFSRNLYRTQKIDKIYSVVLNENEKLLSYALCNLQYIPVNAIKINTSLYEKEYCPFELGLVCNIYGIKELQEKLDYINNIITDTLFWQSKSDINKEKEYILQNSEFQYYECLEHTCFDGKLCEIGVFKKNEKKAQ